MVRPGQQLFLERKSFVPMVESVCVCLCVWYKVSKNSETTWVNTSPLSLSTGTNLPQRPPASSDAHSPWPLPGGWWAGSTTSSRQGVQPTSSPMPSSSRGMSSTYWTSSCSCWWSPWAPRGSVGSCWAWWPGGCVGPGSWRRPEAQGSLGEGVLGSHWLFEVFPQPCPCFLLFTFT